MTSIFDRVAVQFQYNVIMSMNRQVDWNDHICDFIKVRAKNPDFIKRLVQREEEQTTYQLSSQKIKRYSRRFEQSEQSLTQLLKQIERQQTTKHLLQKQFDDISDELSKLEAQSQTILIKKQDSRSWTQDCSEHAHSQSQIIDVERQRSSKQQYYQLMKLGFQKQIQNLIATRIALQEDQRKYSAAIIQIKAREQLSIEFDLKNQELVKLRQAYQLSRENNKRLIETHRAKVLQFQKPILIMAERKIGEQSRKRVEDCVNEAKRMLFSQHRKNSQKYQSFLQRHHYLKGQIIQQEHGRYINEHPEVISSGKNISSQWMNLGNEEDLAKQVRSSFSTKAFAQDYFSLEEALSACSAQLSQLQQEELACHEEAETLKANYQRKMKEIQCERNRRKSKRII